MNKFKYNEIAYVPNTKDFVKIKGFHKSKYFKYVYDILVISNDRFELFWGVPEGCLSKIKKDLRFIEYFYNKGAII